MSLDKMDDVQYIHGVAMDAIEEMYAFHPIRIDW